MSGSFSYVASEKLGNQIAEILELPVNQIVSMKIIMNIGGPAIVEVEMICPDDQGQIATIVNQYRLVQVDVGP